MERSNHTLKRAWGLFSIISEEKIREKELQHSEGLIDRILEREQAAVQELGIAESSLRCAKDSLIEQRDDLFQKARQFYELADTAAKAGDKEEEIYSRDVDFDKILSELQNSIKPIPSTPRNRE